MSQDIGVHESRRRFKFQSNLGTYCGSGHDDLPIALHLEVGLRCRKVTLLHGRTRSDTKESLIIDMDI